MPLISSLNRSVKNESISTIFGKQNIEEASRQKIINLSISPAKYSHCTL